MRSPWRPETAGRAIFLGASIVFAIECAHLLASLAFVAPATTVDLFGQSNYRLSIIVSLLIGFVSFALAYGSTAERCDFGARGRELGWSEERLAALLAQRAPRLRSALVSALLVAPAGSLMITGADTSRPFLMTQDPWTFSVAWATGANLLLFGLVGAMAYTTWAWARVERSLDAVPARLDLLDTTLDRRLAGAGLRRSFFWLAGSSLASFVFVDLEFSWMTGLAVGITLSIGTFLFVSPLVRLARRIGDAKERELARVRERIRLARDGLFEAPGAGPAAIELPALLAYEQRIGSVRVWAIDVPQILRFTTLFLLAVGSWLGGSIMDHLVERLLR